MGVFVCNSSAGAVFEKKGLCVPVSADTIFACILVLGGPI